MSEEKEKTQVSQSTRSYVSAQWQFEAALKSYDAAAVAQNEKAMEEAARKCHDALDVVLVSKERVYREYCGGDFNVSYGN